MRGSHRGHASTYNYKRKNTGVKTAEWRRHLPGAKPIEPPIPSLRHCFTISRGGRSSPTSKMNEVTSGLVQSFTRARIQYADLSRRQAWHSINRLKSYVCPRPSRAYAGFSLPAGRVLNQHALQKYRTPTFCLPVLRPEHWWRTRKSSHQETPNRTLLHVVFSRKRWFRYPRSAGRKKTFYCVREAP